MYCQDPPMLYREMCASSFYGLTNGAESESVAEEYLVEYAVNLWNNPLNGLASDLEEDLADIDEDRYAPLTRTGVDRLTLAEQSYAC